MVRISSRMFARRHLAGKFWQPVFFPPQVCLQFSVSAPLFSLPPTPPPPVPRDKNSSFPVKDGWYKNCGWCRWFENHNRIPRSGSPPGGREGGRPNPGRPVSPKQPRRQPCLHLLRRYRNRKTRNTGATRLQQFTSQGVSGGWVTKQ